MERGPAEVMFDMLKSGPAGEVLYRSVLLYLKALVLETGAAVEAGKSPPGLPQADGRLSLVVPREPVIVYFVLLPDVRELRVTDLIWMA
jgi:hypothetical protein